MDKKVEKVEVGISQKSFAKEEIHIPYKIKRN